MADAVSVLEGGGRGKALPPSIVDCCNITDALLVFSVPILLVVALIAAAYTDDGASPRTSASAIATMILAQYEGIFSTVSEGWK